MKRYIHKENGRIVKVLEVFEKSGTVLVEYEDDHTTKNFSPSTMKRWWKELPEEEQETEKTEATKYVEASQKITKELNKNNSKSLQEMVDAQADENKAVEKVTKKKATKKSEKTGNKRNSREDSEHIEGILQFVDDAANKIGAEKYIRDKQPNFYNYKIGESKVLFTLHRTHKAVQLFVKSRTIPEKYAKSLESVNGFFDKRLNIVELNKNVELLIDNIIDSLKEEVK